MNRNIKTPFFCLSLSFLLSMTVLAIDGSTEIDWTEVDATKAAVAAEETAYPAWVDGQVNSAVGVWTPSGDNFTATDGRGVYVVARSAPAGGGEFELNPIEVTTLAVTVVYDTPAGAATARMKPLSLYRGYQCTSFARGDDSDAAVLPFTARDAFNAHTDPNDDGYGITYFINGREGLVIAAWENFPQQQFKAPDFLDVAAYDQSIGSHSYTHPNRIPWQTRNQQFWEVMKLRAEREAEANMPIMTVAPPYGTFGDQGTMDLWVRAGHYGFAQNPASVLDTHGYRDIIGPQTAYCFLTNYHLRGMGREGSAGYERCRVLWKQLCDDQSIWTPNFNKFSSYRMQYAHTGIAKSVAGNAATFTIYRPSLIDLNDAIPLTLSLYGYGAATVQNVTASDGAFDGVKTGVQLPTRPNGAPYDGYTFNLGFPANQAVPRRIGFTENPDNGANPDEIIQDDEFPGIKGIVHYDSTARQIRILLQDNSDGGIDDLSLTLRIPFGWNKSVIRKKGLRIVNGAKLNETIDLDIATTDPYLLSGAAYFTVQADFKLAGQQSRLYLTDFYNMNLYLGDSFASGHFEAVGFDLFPFRHHLDMSFDELFLQAPPPSYDPGVTSIFQVLRSDMIGHATMLLNETNLGHVLGWERKDDGYIYIPDFVQCGYVPLGTMSRMFTTDYNTIGLEWYMARGTFTSDRSQSVVVGTDSRFLAVNGIMQTPAFPPPNALTMEGYTFNVQPGVEYNVLLIGPIVVVDLTYPVGFRFKVCTASDFAQAAPGIAYKSLGDREPIVSFENVAPGQTLFGTANLVALARDPAGPRTDCMGIDHVTFSLLRDGVPVGAPHTDIRRPFTWSLDTTPIADGVYTIRAAATTSAPFGEATGKAEQTICIVNADNPPQTQPEAFIIGPNKYSKTDTQIYIKTKSNVLANDQEQHKDAMTAVGAGGAAHGAATLRADGTFDYSATNYFGADEFTYRARDAGGHDSAVTTVSLTVDANVRGVQGQIANGDFERPLPSTPCANRDWDWFVAATTHFQRVYDEDDYAIRIDESAITSGGVDMMSTLVSVKPNTRYILSWNSKKETITGGYLVQIQFKKTPNDLSGANNARANLNANGSWETGSTKGEYVPNSCMFDTEGATALWIRVSVSDGLGVLYVDDFDLTEVVNHVPVSADSFVTINLGEPSTLLGARDFPFFDADPHDRLSKVRIVSLPSEGSIQKNGIAMTAGDEVTSSDLVSSMRYYHGAGGASFTFKVSDGKDWSETPRTLYLMEVAAPTAASEVQWNLY